MSNIEIKLGDTKEFRSTKEWPYHVSCGGVVFRKIDNSVEVLLLHRSKDFNIRSKISEEESYHLPKGTLGYCETMMTCALREVQEEAGVNSIILAYLGSIIGDWVSKRDEMRKIKDANYFLMEYSGENEKGMDDEHEKKLWVSIGDARQNLSFEKEIIDRAESAMKKIGILK